MKPVLAAFALLLTSASLGSAAAPAPKERRPAHADAATQKAPAAGAPQKDDYAVVTTIKIGGNWLWQTVLVDPDGKFIYTSKGGKGAVFDAATGKQVAEIQSGQDISGIAIAPDAGRGFIADRTGNVTVFDTKTYHVLGTIAIGATPGPITYDALSKRILVVCDDKLIPIDPAMNLATGKPEPAIDLTSKITCMLADGQGTVYLGGLDHEEVDVVDTRIMKQVTTWSVYTIGRPVGMSMDPNHGRLFMGCRDRVIVMSASDGHIIGNVGVGKWVMGTAFSDGKVFAADQDGTVSILGQDAAGKFATEQTISLGGSPHPPKSDPKTGEIYIPQVDLNGHRGIDGTFKLFVLGKK